jgi:hypothetical protein
LPKLDTNPPANSFWLEFVDEWREDWLTTGGKIHLDVTTE